MPWNANDALRQAAQRRAQLQQRSYRSSRRRAARQIDDLMAQYRSRKGSVREHQGVHQQPDTVFMQSGDSVPRSGGRSKAVLVPYVFIGVTATVIVAMGSAVL